MIGFSNNRVSTFSKLIRFFTRSPISHSFVWCGPTAGLDSVLEANLTVEVSPFKKHYQENAGCDYVLFQVVAPNDVKEKALQYAFTEFAGVTYGLLQCVWFIYRWANELIGRDIRKQNNWMSRGVVCSEVVYWYLYSLGGEYTKLLKPWNPDTIQADDLRRIVIANPNLFGLVESKDYENGKFLERFYDAS